MLRFPCLFVFVHYSDLDLFRFLRTLWLNLCPLWLLGSVWRCGISLIPILALLGRNRNILIMITGME